MHITALITTLLATASITAYGKLAVDSGYVSSVIDALNEANFTALAGALQKIDGTTEGAAFFARVTDENIKTWLAPTNEAFARAPESILSNTTVLADVLSYHVLDAYVNPKLIETGRGRMIVRSFYHNGMLPDNKSQVVVADTMNNTETGIQTLAFPYQENNVTVYGAISPLSSTNFTIYPIDAVLSLPRTLGDAATTFFPSSGELLGQAGLLHTLAETKGITVFAPNDAAISDAGAVMKPLNSTQIAIMLSNHVINGTAASAFSLNKGNYTSAGGEPFTFSANTSGAYVTSGNTTARILAIDIPIANGMVHIIDRVLDNTNSNTAAAQSAASTSAAEATGIATGTARLSTPISAGVIGCAMAIFAGIFAGAVVI